MRRRTLEKVRAVVPVRGAASRPRSAVVKAAPAATGEPAPVGGLPGPR
jgi:hypothetical protein